MDSLAPRDNNTERQELDLSTGPWYPSLGTQNQNWTFLQWDPKSQEFSCSPVPAGRTLKQFTIIFLLSSHTVQDKRKACFSEIYFLSLPNKLPLICLQRLRNTNGKYPFSISSLSFLLKHKHHTYQQWIWFLRMWPWWEEQSILLSLILVTSLFLLTINKIYLGCPSEFYCSLLPWF